MLIRRRTVRLVPLASSVKGGGGIGRVRLAASGTKSGTHPSVYLTVHYASERERARATGSDRLFLVAGVDVTKLPWNTPRNLAIF